MPTAVYTGMKCDECCIAETAAKNQYNQHGNKLVEWYLMIFANKFIYATVDQS